MMTRNVPSKSVLSLLIRTIVCTIAITSLSRGVHAQQSTCVANGPNKSFDSISDKVCSTPELTKLCGLLSETGLDRMLDTSSTGTFTLFAPTDLAFNKASPADIGYTPEQIRKTLKYHITNPQVQQTDLSCTDATLSMLSVNGRKLTSTTVCADGDTGTRTAQLGKTTIGGGLPTIRSQDDTPCNGYIIILNEVMGSSLRFLSPPKKNHYPHKGGKGAKGYPPAKKGPVKKGWINLGKGTIAQNDLFVEMYGVSYDGNINNGYNNNQNNRGYGYYSGKGSKGYGYYSGKGSKGYGYYGRRGRGGNRRNHRNNNRGFPNGGYY